MCFKVRRLERGWFSQNQPSFQPWNLRYESWNGVGFRKTNRHSNHRLRYTKVGTGLVFAKPFAKPTAVPTMGYDIRRLERGCFSQNQPPFQPWASIYEGWNAVGFRKPTVNPTVAAHVWGLGNGWFSSIQPSVQPCALRYEGWNAVGFRKSNYQSNRCRSCMRFGKRFVFVNPTVIPTMYFKKRKLERCWFSQIQLSIQPLPLMYKGWKTVGFRQSYRHSNHVL